jgi:choline-sulfatase
MLEDTAILFVSDHGDMLGERGLWFTMNFFEGSSRVPLMVAAPGVAPGATLAPVSTLDVLPTLADLAGIDLGAGAEWIDGVSLLDTLSRGRRREAVPMEYAAEGSVAPMVAIREGRWKYTHCPADPDQLFDLDADPRELHDLAGDPARGEVLEAFRARAETLWDLGRFDREVRQSQARRHVTYEALRNGAYYPWDFQPLQKASERYMRNHMDLNILEESQRFPRGE